MTKYALCLLALLLLVACETKKKETPTHNIERASDQLDCTDSGCTGTYKGPEFVAGADVAHQFSNAVCKTVGMELKSLYQRKEYKKVDLNAIQMTTEGMGSGNVIYSVSIPFVAVQDSCEAFTSFDHVGGWNHAPELDSRKQGLQSLLLPGDSLHISPLTTTPEGLQEYWIQWRNKELQAGCAGR